MREILPLAAYLEGEQRLGRVAASVDPEATARLRQPEPDAAPSRGQRPLWTATGPYRGGHAPPI